MPPPARSQTSHTCNGLFVLNRFCRKPYNCCSIGQGNTDLKYGTRQGLESFLSLWVLEARSLEQRALIGLFRVPIWIIVVPTSEGEISIILMKTSCCCSKTIWTILLYIWKCIMIITSWKWMMGMFLHVQMITENDTIIEDILKVRNNTSTTTGSLFMRLTHKNVKLDSCLQTETIECNFSCYINS